jgi:hypothetical protein
MSTGSGMINSGTGVSAQGATLDAVVAPTLDTATAPNLIGPERLHLGQLEQPIGQKHEQAVECHEVTIRGLLNRTCVVSTGGLSDLFGCDDVTVANQDGHYRIQAAGRKFILKNDGTLLGDIRSKDQSSVPDAKALEHQALARILLVGGRAVFVPPTMSAKTVYECPPTSRAVDEAINRIQRAVRKMSYAVMDVLGVQHASADRALVGECSVETSAIAVTVDLTGDEQAVSRQSTPYTMKFRLYSDGSLEIKEAHDWFFHRCEAGNPSKGFIWHEIREWVNSL